MSKYIKTQITVTRTEAGETIEEQIRRLVANKQPIPEDVPPIYTAKEDGVLLDHDIRADRFDNAYDATDKFAASKTAQGADRAYEPKDEEPTEEKHDIKQE